MEIDGARPCVRPASASRKRSSVSVETGVSAVARRNTKPFRAKSIPTLAAQDTARSNGGSWARPRAVSRVSMNRTPAARREASFCRIISSPVFATDGQWIKRRSSPSWNARIVK